MIDEKIKEAWGWAQRINTSFGLHTTENLLRVVVYAYVAAEARARMAEWIIGHGNYSTRGFCRDPQHSWTLGDYVKEVEAELEKP